MKKLLPSSALALAIGFAAAPLQAASHSDAPRIKQDPQANLTDVYAFIGTKYDNAALKVLNVVVHVRPFSEPGDGVIYDRFADDALYSIHITSPTTGETIRRYDFNFSSVGGGYKNLDTILQYGLGTAVGAITTIGDAQQNYTQTYELSVFEPAKKKNKTTLLSPGLPVAPPNVGLNVTPSYNGELGQAVSGADSFANLDSLTKQAVKTVGNLAVFAGPRDDGFFADTPGIFDLLNYRILDNNGTLADGFGQDGNGVDGFKGFNVLAYGLQIPVSALTDIPGYPNVGVFASVSRRGVEYKKDGTPNPKGDWTQVNRMGNPLFNEVLVATRDKDKYNRTLPKDDAKEFQKYADNSEVAALINAVYSLGLVTTGRTDLRAIFIPDVLRINTATNPVPLAGQEGFNRLSFIGGDLTNGSPSGWPNGRRLGDDVVDIALTAIASGPAYTTITTVGDNVEGNDLPYNQVFPYSATPHSGTNNSKDSMPVVWQEN